MSQTKAQLIDPVDGSLVNADINASAAIAGSKISPDFGSQNVVTTGTITSNNIEISGTLPRLSFTDSNNNPDYQVQNNDGTFIVRDTTNSADRFRVNTDGHVDIGGNLDVGAGIDVTGAITGTGDLTIDTNTLKVDSSNNRVGIGTTSPTKVLEVTGTSSPQILLKPGDASPAIFVGDSNRSGDGQHLAEFRGHWNGTNVARMIIQAGDDTTNKDNGQIVFMTSATGTTSERLRINEGGDVGINESAPSARLHVNGGGGLFVERSAGTSVAGFKQSGGAAMNIYFQNSGSTNHPSIGSDSESLTLGTGNATRVLINSSGNVGIGTDAPSVKCDISSSDSTAWSTSNLSTGLRVVNSSTTNNVAAGIQLRSFQNNGGASIQYIHCVNDGASSYGSDLVFTTRVAYTGAYRESCRITNAGNLKFPSGHGIDFSATANGGGTTNSELLHDYEEGTWTPTFNFSGSTGTFSYNAQIGRYTKIGNRVFFTCIIRSNGHSGSTTNNLRVAGLPFNVLSDSPSGGTSFFITGGNFTTDYGVATQLVVAEQIEFYRQVQATGSNFNAVQAGELSLDGLFIKVEGHYQTDD